MLNYKEYTTVAVPVSGLSKEVERKINENICSCLASGWVIVNQFVIPACANPNTAERDVSSGYANINNLYNIIVFILAR